jgi:hypothetical protein
MILEAETLIKYGYMPMDLSPQSNKLIITTCDDCGKVRIASKVGYCALCLSCAKKGKNGPMFSKHHSEEAKIAIGKGHKGETSPRKDKILSEETKALISKNHADVSGANNPAWCNGISFEPYCIKFNDEYKNCIRNLFGNECFLCGKTEDNNGRALDVHHVNYNKDCGCDETKCICVPLCHSCHSKTNSDRDFWQCLIMEMLKPFEA